MFGLFKRTQVEDWEKTFLINVFSLLPASYSKYKNQIQEGLLNRVLIDSKENYVGFTYNPNLSRKFENRNEKNFRIFNVEVFSLTAGKFITAEIYFAGGLICGYILSNPKDKVDVLRINIDNYKLEYLDDGIDVLAELLNREELSLINPADFYEVTVNNQLFYHIKDEEDGDFIAIDQKKTVYKITHDPMEITPLNKTLIEYLEALPS